MLPGHAFPGGFDARYVALRRSLRAHGAAAGVRRVCRAVKDNKAGISRTKITLAALQKVSSDWDFRP